jgi:DNA-binding transcriptional regulator LsrR (DeoR family)
VKRDELERVTIARRIYHMHPDREALAERLGLSRHDVAELEADRRRRLDELPPDTTGGRR